MQKSNVERQVDETEMTSDELSCLSKSLNFLMYLTNIETHFVSQEEFLSYGSFFSFYMTTVPAILVMAGMDTYNEYIAQKMRGELLGLSNEI